MSTLILALTKYKNVPILNEPMVMGSAVWYGPLQSLVTLH